MDLVLQLWSVDSPPTLYRVYYYGICKWIWSSLVSVGSKWKVSGLRIPCAGSYRGVGIVCTPWGWIAAQCQRKGRGCVHQGIFVPTTNVNVACLLKQWSGRNRECLAAFHQGHYREGSRNRAFWEPMQESGWCSGYHARFTRERSRVRTSHPIFFFLLFC